MEGLPINFTYWFLQTLAMMLTAFLIPGLTVKGPLGALVTVVALAFVNAVVWDAALFLHIPESFTAQALLLLVSNGAIFWLLVKILPGIEVRGFLPALVAPVVFTVCSLIIDEYGSRVDWLKLFEGLLDFVRDQRDQFREGNKHAN